MNNLNVFYDLNSVLEKELKIKEHNGVVYIIDCGDCVKIGCTKNPYSRLRCLMNVLGRYGNRKIGKIAISKSCTNYYENEKRLHQIFSNNRIEGTELFKVNFNKVLEIADEILLLENNADVINNKSETILQLCQILFNKNETKIDLSSMDLNDIDMAIFYLERYIEAREDMEEFFSGLLIKWEGNLY